MSGAPDLEGPFGRAWAAPELMIHGIDDATAREICRLAVDCIVHGQLSPDIDYRRAWKDAIATTVKHFRDGTHARPS